MYRCKSESGSTNNKKKGVSVLLQKRYFEKEGCVEGKVEIANAQAKK